VTEVGRVETIAQLLKCCTVCMDCALLLFTVLLLARDRRGEAFSHCRTCVSKFSGMRVRERNKHVTAIENFGRQNGKRGLKECLVREAAEC